MPAEPSDRETIVLRPVTPADLPMLAEWIARPHWQEWWGDVETEIGHIRAMVDGRDPARPFIFEIGGKPAGYTQYWFADDEKTEQRLAEYPWLNLLPDGCVGIDISIAASGSLSKGIGSAVVRLMARKLWRQGHRNIIIDPDASNARAVRAYEKAGFRAVNEWLGKTGDYLIMQFEPDIENEPA